MKPTLNSVWLTYDPDSITTDTKYPRTNHSGIFICTTCDHEVSDIWLCCIWTLRQFLQHVRHRHPQRREQQQKAAGKTHHISGLIKHHKWEDAHYHQQRLANTCLQFGLPVMRRRVTSWDVFVGKNASRPGNSMLHTGIIQRSRTWGLNGTLFSYERIGVQQICMRNKFITHTVYSRYSEEMVRRGCTDNWETRINKNV